MGEYAKYGGKEVKIGTCESMYYLRFEDRGKVQAIPHSLNPAGTENLFWRLPFPDEDHIGPGGYQDYNRGLRLYRTVKDPYGRPQFDRGEDFEDQETVNDPGIIQLSHRDAGLLINVPCYHGLKLPDVVKPMQAFWNGKGHSFELAHVKNHKGRGLMPLVRCRHCGQMWRHEWAEILPYVADKDMLQRLIAYSEQCTPAQDKAA